MIFWWCQWKKLATIFHPSLAFEIEAATIALFPIIFTHRCARFVVNEVEELPAYRPACGAASGRSRRGLYLAAVAAAAGSIEAGLRAARGSSLLCRREEGRKKTFANIVLLRALPENSGLVSGGMVFHVMD